MYARARVAITLMYQLPSGVPEGARINPLHVGHARTLLLGSLIAKKHGCPFHVRCDGTFLCADSVPPMDFDRGNQIMGLVNLMLALEIPFDKIYWAPLEPTSMTNVTDSAANARVAEAIWKMSGRGNPPGHFAAILDDALDHAPSLMVRGSEFTHAGGNAFRHDELGMAPFVLAEDMMFEALGAEKHEVNVPMIYLGAGKMSKSEMRMVPWEILTGVPVDLARRFLLATAVRAEDPIAAMAMDDAILFAPDMMNYDPYAWNWEHWNQVARMVPSAES